MMMMTGVLSRRMLRVCPVRALEDNYMYIVYNEKNNQGVAVDPVNPDAIQKTAKDMDVSIVAALVTHHHYDHAGGMGQFRQMYGKGVKVYGGDERIDHIDLVVPDRHLLDIAGMQIRCLSTPCHTRGHICFHVTLPDDQAGIVLTGDTLFVAGCGKFFEGTAQEMHTNLNEVLASLPDATKVYAGHEYTASNLKFAKHVEPDNQRVAEKLAWSLSCGSRNEPTMPSTISDEKASNPFMRVSHPSVQKFAGSTDPVQVLDALRTAKNHFKPPA